MVATSAGMVPGGARWRPAGAPLLAAPAFTYLGAQTATRRDFLAAPHNFWRPVIPTAPVRRP